MSVFQKIIPVPRNVEITTGTFTLPVSGLVYTNFDAANDFTYLLNLLGLEKKETAAPSENGYYRLSIGVPCDAVLTAPDNREGYTLQLKESSADICAITKTGIANALKTLVKLKELGEEIPCAVITDCPELAFRGLHMCIFNPDDGTQKDDTSYESTRKVILNAAMSGYNTITLEFWGMFPNPRRPYAYWPKAYTMDQVKSIVSFIIDDLYMDVVPCQNLTSHAGWSRIASRQHVVLDQRPDLADMWIPGGWCFATENPATREYLKDIMDELIIAFRHPKYFHISTDKAFGFGSTEEDRTRPADILFMSHVTWLNTYLQEKGITTIMWNDMLYSCTDSLFWKMDKALCDHLPTNIVINVWTHNDPGEYWPDALFFEEKGFQTVYSPFMNESSIKNMISIAKRGKSLGLMQTSWHKPIASLPYVTLSGALQWGDVEPTKDCIERTVNTWYK